MEGGLSRAYSIGRLKAFREDGKISDDFSCTPDSGESWISVGAVLASNPDVPAAKSAVAATSGASSSSVSAAPAGSGVAAAPAAASASSQASSDASSIAEHEAMRSEILALEGKVTAEDMFQRRGRNSPTGRELTPAPENVSSQSAAALPELEKNSNSSQAALVALKRARKRKAEGDATPGQDTPPQPRSSVLLPLGLGTLAGAVSGLLVAIVGMPLMAPTPTTNTVEPAASLVKRADLATMTNRELTAHLQVLSAQLKYIAEQSSTDLSGMPIPESFNVLSRPPVPLQPYVAVGRTNKSDIEATNTFSKYVALVRAEGPDGRKLSEGTVETFTARLRDLMMMPGRMDSTRPEAARDLAEKTKLLYLLQLGNLRSAEAAKRVQSVATIADATESGLRALFAEFVTNDMSFDLILLSASAAERTELILIRYWCYRAANPVGATQWLKRVTANFDDLNLAYISQAIAEVDEME